MAPVVSFTKYLTRETISVVCAAILFLLVPVFPDSVLYLTDNLIIRGVLIAVCLLALQYDGLLAIVTFLVVARMFLERNSRKIRDAKAVINVNSPKEDVVLPEVDGEIAETEAKVDRTVYSPSYGDELPYIPNDEVGDNAFHSVENSIDEKRVPSIVAEGEVAAHEVFGDVRPGNFTNDA